MLKKAGILQESEAMNMGAAKTKGASLFPIKVIAERWRAFNSFGHKLKIK